VEILGEMLKVCQASLGFLNLVADYAERRMDLGHDDDCFLPAGKHSRGATLALLFTHSRCPDTRAPKAPEAYRGCRPTFQNERVSEMVRGAGPS
jgi:hypothetical protein